MKENLAYKFCPKCGGSLSGKKIDFLDCPSCGFRFYLNAKPCVTALITDGPKILLTRRATAPKSGQWDLPGGFMAKEETAIEALKREIKEELGITLTEIKFFDSKAGKYRLENIEYDIIDFYFLAQYRGNLKVAKNENSEAAFFELTKLPALAFKNHQAVAQELKNRLT